MSNTVRREILGWIQIALGIALGAAAYRMYLIPNDIAPGGFTGIGQLVNSQTGWPIGLISLALNAPLFALSWHRMGAKFMGKSLIAMMAFNFALDHLPLGALTDDAMLACLFGGALAGVGFGLILRGGASTGGSDMLGTLVNDHFPALKISSVSLMLDICVITASAFVFNPTSAMYAMISAFLFAQVLDFVLDGISSAKCYYIISEENERIAKHIHLKLNRGVTALRGLGTYTGADKLVLMCVITRFESVRLRNIVTEIDPTAFVVATRITEAIGEGFKPHKKPKG